MLDVSLVIPTYNEVKNLPLLLEEVMSVIDKNNIDLEFIIVDDNSPDGTGSVAQELGQKYPVKVIHRAGKMGLGSAVIEGFNASIRPYVGVMDADLSHDPSILNELIFSLEKNDIAIGSRFKEGSVVEDWKWWRKAISLAGVFFAKKITRVADPLSGFFFLRKKVIENINLKTKGYKILLEILVKGRYSNIKEIPFIFRMRKFSFSKLNYSEYLLFFGQLIKYGLYSIYKHVRHSHDRIHFIGLVALTAVLLFYRLAARSFWMDEAAVLEYLYQTPSPFSFLIHYFAVPDNHPPLYYFLVISLYRVFPWHEVGIRLVSVLSGLGIVVLVYNFANLLFKDKSIAKLAMFLTAISSYFILISQMARYHSLAAFLTLGSLYYFCRIILQGYSKKDFIKFLILAVLVAYTDLPHFIYLTVITNLFYFYKKLKKLDVVGFKRWVTGQLTLLVLFPPIIYLFYLRVFHQNDKGFEKEGLLGGSMVDKLVDFSMHFYAYFFGENIFPWNIAAFLMGVLVLIVLLVVLIKTIFKERILSNLNLLLYLFISLIVLNTIFLNYADPRYNFIVFPKYVFVAFPLFIILISVLISRIKSPAIKWLLILAVSGISIYGLQNFYRATNYLNGSYFNNFKSYQFVQYNAQAGDYLIINGDLNIGVYDFYKETYFKNLKPVLLADVSSVLSDRDARFWFFSTGSDGDSAYSSATAASKIPDGLKIIAKFESVPIDPILLEWKRKITGRQSYQYKYGLYLLTKK